LPTGFPLLLPESHNRRGEALDKASPVNVEA